MADITKIKLPGDTEARNIKDSRISTQTAYTSKGSATKVPQITTNSLGQVTNITEVTITDNNDNQKVKTSTVTFGKNDVVEIVGGTNVSVSGDATAKTVTISATDTDTGATSIETTGSGNAVTTASYNADTRKITLTKGSTFLTSHQNIKALDTTATTAQSTSSNEAIKGSGTIILHKIAKTGTYSDLIGKPTIPTVNDAILTIKVEGTSKGTFTANASSNVEINITASDLGLSSALKYRGATTTTKPTAGKYIQTVIGSTTYYVSITDSGTATQQDAQLGDVISVGVVEYVCKTAGASGTNVFTQIGDESSYALKSVKVEGSGVLSGGGNLTTNRTITHNAGSAASKSSGLYKISTDAYSHVASATAVEKADITALGIPAQDTTYGVATSDTAGLVKSTTTGTTANRYYNVEVNNDGTMKVNVPWSNTATASDDILDGSNSGTAITYKPYTTQQSKLSFDTSTTNPTRTDRLNLNGYFYATKLYSGGTEVLTSHQNIKNLKTDNTTAQTATSENIKGSGTINLHKVSKTGSYNDLLNKPSIPSSATSTTTVTPNTITLRFYTDDTNYDEYTVVTGIASASTSTTLS